MEILNLANNTKDEIIAKAVEVLASGGLVIFPTETVYGIGADATNQAAIDKLLAYKDRREGKPLSIAVTDLTMAEKYVEVNDQAKDLYKRFLPGPLTVISKSKGKVAKGVTSEFNTLGTRIPDYPLVLEIVRACGKPMTATSANVSDGREPYKIDHIFDKLSEKQKNLIDLVIDAGELPKNPPSTVIDTTLSTPVTLRSGNSKADNSLSTKYQVLSTSENETKSIAGRLLLQHWNEIRENGLVIGLDGELGAGKTIFTKGVAEFLGITETITSPTYNYIEEYNYTRHQTTGKLYHLDLWKVESEEELKRLEIEKLIKPKNVIVIEWFSQMQDFQKLEIKSNLIIELTELKSEQRVLNIKNIYGIN